MFTGIIQAKGKIAKAKTHDKGVYIDVHAPRSWKIAKGASVAVDGICLTATRSKPGVFSAYLMPETLRKTTGASWAKGREVNLERALREKDLLDGHLIQGHVDGRARVTGTKEEGPSRAISLSLPRALLKGVALHGSIAVNGVSLTVSRLRGSVATVSLIPYTLSRTNLGSLRKGDEANVEADFLARHYKGGRVRGNEARRARKSA